MELDIRLVMFYLLQEEFWKNDYTQWTYFTHLTKEIRNIASELHKKNIIKIIDKRLAQYKP